jgi:E3 Ubiquitin ligase
MPSIDFLLVFLIAGTLSILCFSYVMRYFKIYQLIKDTPTTEIEYTDVGIAEVKGTIVEQKEVLSAPLSGKPCVFYSFVVSEQKSSGKNSYWKEIINDVRYIKCCIDDGTGEVQLILREAELILNEDSHMSTGTFNSATPQLEKMLKDRYHTSTKGWVFNKSMKYKETILEYGDEIYALGDFSKENEINTMKKGKDKIFIVSDKGEENVKSKYFMKGILWCLVTITPLIFAVLYMFYKPLLGM